MSGLYRWYDDADDYVLPSYEDECEDLMRHVEKCTLAERDIYCKICNEY